MRQQSRWAKRLMKCPVVTATTHHRYGLKKVDNAGLETRFRRRHKL